MKKIIFISAIFSISLFGNSNNLNISEAIDTLNKATVKLIKNQEKFEDEIRILNKKILELEKNKKNEEIITEITPSNIKEVVLKEKEDTKFKNKVVVNTWYASLRTKPNLEHTSVRKATAGNIFDVIEESGSFYLLDNGLYIHKTTVSKYKPLKLYVKTNGQIELLTGKDKMTKKVFAGNVLNAVATHQSGKWFILDDGGFIDKNIVEIEE